MKKKVLSILLAATFTVSMLQVAETATLQQKTTTQLKQKTLLMTQQRKKPKMTPQQRTQQATVTLTLL